MLWSIGIRQKSDRFIWKPDIGNLDKLLLSINTVH
jgi:hypothetical protein